MHRFQDQFKALGSDVELTVLAPGQDSARALFERLHDQTDAFEKRFSRFLPDSELTHLNQHAGTKTRISAEMHDLLRETLRLAARTTGLFNPLILPKLQQAGYRSSWPGPRAKSNAPLYLTRSIRDAAEIKLEKETVLLPTGTALDFGGIGKGYLLEILAKLTAPEFANFWFSLGGDILAQGHDIGTRHWQIGVAAAASADSPAGFFEAASGAVATSGISKRQGVHDGRSWHHIIDPRTGRPAKTDLLTATVAHPKATSADVIAKCAVILGSGEAWQFASRLGATGAILQTAGSVTKLGSAK